MFGIHSSLNLVLLIVALFNQRIHSAKRLNSESDVADGNQQQQVLEEWDYEPRVWSIDDNYNDEQTNYGDYLAEGSPNNNLEDYYEHNIKDEQTTTSSITDDRLENFFHRKNNYYLNSIVENLLIKQLQDDNNDDGDTINDGSQPSTSTEEAPAKKDECTQFRVDTREAVVCDKTRCDKFDFDWPKYDNQIIMIQTTKHGMRFHRGDFTFQEKPKVKFGGATKDEKIKFDLLELFKPTSTTAATTLTSSSSSTTTTSTVAPPASTSTTTKQPPIESTTSGTEESTTTTTSFGEPSYTSSPSSPSVTTFVPYFSTVSSTYNPQRGIDTSQDLNNTQLVTTFRLDTKRTKQKMIGFGGALSDSTCRNIKSLSPQMAKSLMEDYYGDRGIRYNIARLSIGSSDFSTTPYTNNDREPPAGQASNKNNDNNKLMFDNSLKQNNTNKIDLLSRKITTKLFAIDEKDDVEMNNFRLVDEDYEYKLPIARQAIATSRNRELKFFSSLWSPPIWMKNNSHIVHGYLKGDVYGPYYKALAELILKWFEAYRKNGIEFWATTGLNEPVTGIKPFIFHNSLGMTKSDYITFFKLYLGPMMRQRGFQNVKLLLLDDNKGYAPFWVKEALEDSELSKYISGIAFHWYMNDEYENLNFLEKQFPDKFIISSEACNGFLPFQVHPMPGDWDRGVAYMYDIIKIIQKNAAAWVDWNMVLDLTGGPSWAKNNLDAPIIVNKARDEYYKSPMFYALGHFSRFVEPNSMRLDYIIANAKFDYPVEAVAFHTPNEYIVIVALNSNKYSVPFKIIVDKQLIRILTLRADSFNTIIFKWKKRLINKLRF